MPEIQQYTRRHLYRQSQPDRKLYMPSMKPQLINTDNNDAGNNQLFGMAVVKQRLLGYALTKADIIPFINTPSAMA